MKKLLMLFSCVALTPTLWAASQTVTLSVPGMNCATCPIIIKKSLSKVAGVTTIEVSYERREAKVTFDDEKTTLATLQEATKNAGFPSVLTGAVK